MNYVSYPVPRSRQNLEKVLVSILFGLVIFGLALVILVFGTQIWFAGRIVPGVMVGGVDVGGLRPQDAALKIAAGVSYPQQGKILLRDGDRIWVARPADLGLYVDPQVSAQAAYQIGRSGWLLGQLQEEFTAAYSGQEVAPSMIFDQRAAYAYLNRLAKEINQPAVEATLQLNGTNVTVSPGQVGRTLDLQKNLGLVSQQLQSLRDGVIDLKIDTSAPVILDASQQAELARGILSQPLTLALPAQDSGAGPWTIDPQALSAMLTFERVQTGASSQYEVRLNESMLRAYLSNLGPSLSRTPQNARFTFNDDTHQLELLQPAVIGRELDIDNSIKAIQEKL
jgi:hypothetical protein